ncbi:dihydropteroate synthase [Niveibacterium umoris]|uniref:dihydropteroate synthase n=1 Tax=Niveibacterium umoris TaxID=1193620 RepID=A0A840BIB4_9RHOO|nr:dihydropteroate synthase [Niveibacterium umoris]
MKIGRFDLPVARPLVMAIINVTPDSFSGDGFGNRIDAAVNSAQMAIAAGADIIDVGGESSRPGAASVSLDEEMRRVVPVVEAIARLGVPVSVDTTKPEVMAASIAVGASLINDINALQAPGAMEAVAASDCAVCLMHKKGEPGDMQNAPRYDDAVDEVWSFLHARKLAALDAGIESECILIDPGFGFGKTLAHNLALFGALERFGELAPVLVGVSRKSMLGEITELPVDQRVVPSVVAAVAAASRGATILRVHDVAQTVAGLKVWQKLGGSINARSGC